MFQRRQGHRGRNKHRCRWGDQRSLPPASFRRRTCNRRLRRRSVGASSGRHHRRRDCFPARRGHSRRRRRSAGRCNRTPAWSRPRRSRGLPHRIPAVASWSGTCRRHSTQHPSKVHHARSRPRHRWADPRSRSLARCRPYIRRLRWQGIRAVANSSGTARHSWFRRWCRSPRYSPMPIRQPRPSYSPQRSRRSPP
jgi:hypothetical protein